MTATAYSNPDRKGRRRIGAAAALLVLVGACSGCWSESGSPINVVIRLPGPSQTLSKAELSVDYSRSGAHPAGAGTPACTVLLPSVEASFLDDGNGRLNISVRSRQGFLPPVDLVACRMTANGKLTNPARVQAGLRIEIRTATGVDGSNVNEKRLSTLSSRVRTRASTTKRPGGPERTKRHAPVYARASDPRSPPMFAAGPHRNEDVRRSTRGDRRDEPALRDSGDAALRPLDRIEQSRVESPADDSRPQPPGGVGVAPAANPGLPTILSSARSPGEEPSGTSGSGISGGTVGKPDPSTALPTHDYQVTVSVLSSSGDLGALQINLNFVGDSGKFLGRGDSVACTNLAAGAVVAFNRQNRGVTAGFIDLSGIPTPGPIVSCKFRSRENVAAQSFQVQVTDASDTKSTKLDPPPFVGVNDVSLLN